MIPDWLTQKLADVPDAGAGIHAWLFSCARQLHAHVAPDVAMTMLQLATARCKRHVTAREIRDAVQNSHEVRWVRGEVTDGRSAPKARVESGSTGVRDFTDRWPKPDPVARRCRLADAATDGVATLYDLWGRSPARRDDWTADDWIDWLFPDAEWLCLATDHPATARTRRREKWSFGPAENCGLIVPSPMTGPGGKGLDGRQSHRCLDNTGPRRWLVIEFDSGTIDEQARLHWHLRASSVAAGWPRLKLCVHSAGKSLHGWYGLCDESSGDEDRARELMAYAAGLGADTATWNRCQLVRLPGGARRVEVGAVELPDGWAAMSAEARLEVFFFDPTPNPNERA